MTMLELILVRHGETDSNKKGTYCGWTDTVLNDRGLKQAQLAARKLKGIKPDAVYSSPLKRAYDTACIINREALLEIICSDSLKEQNFGEWEDLSYAEIYKSHPAECGDWANDWANYCMNGGESTLQLYRRVTGFIDCLLESNKSGIILLVTHLGCIRFILSYLLGMSSDGFWRFRVDNGSISRIIINDEGFAYLTALNI